MATKDNSVHGDVRCTADSFIVAEQVLRKGTVVVSGAGMTISPSQVRLRGGYVMNHSPTANCVFVEHSIISARDTAVGEVLTVNMCYFVYDMLELFPTVCDDACRGFKHLPDAEKQQNLYLVEPPVRARAMREGFVVRPPNDKLVVQQNGEMGQTAYAACDIPIGTTLFHATGLIVPFPTMYSCCVGEEQHLLFGEAAECLAHHCDPNVAVTVRSDGTFEMATIKGIQKGDMVTWCYNTTEWELNSPFPCLCGSPVCARTIRGFKHLSGADRERLWPTASNFMKSRVAGLARSPLGNGAEVQLLPAVGG